MRKTFATGLREGKRCENTLPRIKTRTPVWLYSGYLGSLGSIPNASRSCKKLPEHHIKYNIGFRVLSPILPGTYRQITEDVVTKVEDALPLPLHEVNEGMNIALLVHLAREQPVHLHPGGGHGGRVQQAKGSSP